MHQLALDVATCVSPVATKEQLVIGRYLVDCRFVDEAWLPGFKGSALRGLLGRALRNVYCACHSRDCIDCPLASRCLYSLAFEPLPSLQNSRESVQAHPYVIEPPLDQRAHYDAGDVMSFSLILFGKINDRLPHFIYALSEMGRIGFMSGRRPNKARFLIEKISNEGLQIYSGFTETLTSQKNFGRSIGIPQPTEDVKSCKILLLSPVRLKRDNKLTADLSFEVLIRAVLRRIASVFSAFAGSEPKLDYVGLIQKAKLVSVRGSKLAWIDWERYSGRQRARLRLGGLTGEVCYEGDITCFVPMLRIGALLHIGKQTTFGLGSYRIMIETG